MFARILNQDVNEVIYEKLHNLCNSDAMRELTVHSVKSENLIHVFTYLWRKYEPDTEEDMEEIIRNLYLDFCQQYNKKWNKICTMNAFFSTVYKEYIENLNKKYNYFYDLYISGFDKFNDIDTYEIANEINKYMIDVLNEKCYMIDIETVSIIDIEVWLLQIENGHIVDAS